MTPESVRTLVFRLTAVTVVVLLALSVLTAWSALGRFEQILFPELQLKGKAVAEEFKRRIGRAIDYDIPLEQLPGLDEAISEAAAGHRDIMFAALTDANGKVLASYGKKPSGKGDDIVVALEGRGKTVGSFLLRIDPDYLAKASTDLVLEIASIVLVSLLVTFEVLLLVVHLSLEKSSAKQMTEELVPAKAVNLTFIRLPVFLLCLSEELSRPFMPLFAKDLSHTSSWISPELAVSLPITLFMLMWALSQPLGARMSGKIGRQRGFVISVLVGAIGLMATSAAYDLLSLLFWRCVTAVGYGGGLIAAQGLVVDNTTRDNRAQGLAMFVGALLSAGICGPVIGGIIADQLGGRATMLLGGLSALLATGMLFALLGRVKNSQEAQGDETSVIWLDWHILRNRHFSTMMLLSAIPAKVAATGVLFCLVPLMLAESGETSAEIGRVQMMYFVAFILVLPLTAAWSDRLQSRRGFMVAGGVGTLLAMLPVLILPDAWGAPLAIGLFGMVQALISAPQLSLVNQVASRAGLNETAALGWYRMLERIGGALGPLLAIKLAVIFSYRQALIGVGVICGTCALLYWLLFRRKTFPNSSAEVNA